MAQLHEFDQLNNLTRRSEPIDEYFEGMGLPEERRRRREEAARRYLDMMLWYFLLLELGTTIEDAQALLADEYRNAMADLGILDEDLYLYAAVFAAEISRVTREHEDDDWYTSEDRATFIAENEASGSIGWDELMTAMEEGKTQKTWHGMMDRRERDTHRDAEGQTVDIMDFFSVGDAFLLYPHDEVNGSDFPEELVNCRCWCTYS